MRRNGFRKHVTLAFDLLTSGSRHAKRLPWTICLPTLVLIAQAVFFLERGQTDQQTDKHTDATERPTHAGGYAGMGNEDLRQFLWSWVRKLKLGQNNYDIVSWTWLGPASGGWVGLGWAAGGEKSTHAHLWLLCPCQQRWRH